MRINIKFRYYITDTFDGTVKGTNDESIAHEYTQCEEYFVVDSETGKWLLEMGTSQDVEEVKRTSGEDNE